MKDLLQYDDRNHPLNRTFPEFLQSSVEEYVSLHRSPRDESLHPSAYTPQDKTTYLQYVRSGLLGVEFDPNQIHRSRAHLNVDRRQRWHVYMLGWMVVTNLSALASRPRNSLDKRRKPLKGSLYGVEPADQFGPIASLGEPPIFFLPPCTSALVR